MSTLKLVREILDKVYHWHRVPASVETKIKKRKKFYYLWLAIDEQGNPVYASLPSRRDSWTAQVVLSSTEAKGCTTDKGPWYVSAVKKLPIEWFHETFGKRNVTLL